MPAFVGHIDSVAVVLLCCVKYSTELLKAKTLSAVKLLECEEVSALLLNHTFEFRKDGPAGFYASADTSLPEQTSSSLVPTLLACTDLSAYYKPVS